MAGTGRQALGQVVFCLGCCCGRTDRGYPAVPLDHLKTVWKAEKLNASVQLTISGCLGPCDAANVALVLTPGGQEWLGELRTSAEYEALIDWARACRAAGHLLPTPAELAGCR